MNWEHDSEFAAAVAAAAFAIYTLEEAEEEYRRKIRKEFEKSKTEVRTRKEDRSAGSVRVTRSSSTKEVKDAGNYRKIQINFPQEFVVITKNYFTMWAKTSRAGS